MKRHHVEKLASLIRQEGLGQDRLQSDFYSQNSIDLAKALLGKVLVRCLPTGELLRGTIVETEAYPGSEEAADLNVHCFITKQTEKNAGIFMEPGTTWVYMTYGVFNMINISARGPGSACLLRAIEPKDDKLDMMEQFRLLKKPKKVTPPASVTETTRSGRTTRSKSRGSAEDPPAPNKADTEKIEPENTKADEAEEDAPAPVNLSLDRKSKLKFHELANGPGKLCKALNIEKRTCDQLNLTTSSLLWIQENDELKFETGKFEIVESTRIGIGSAPQSSQNDLYRFYVADNVCVSTAKPSQIKKKMSEALEAEGTK